MNIGIKGGKTWKSQTNVFRQRAYWLVAGSRGMLCTNFKFRHNVKKVTGRRLVFCPSFYFGRCVPLNLVWRGGALCDSMGWVVAFYLGYVRRSGIGGTFCTADPRSAGLCAIRGIGLWFFVLGMFADRGSAGRRRDILRRKKSFFKKFSKKNKNFRLF